MAAQNNNNNNNNNNPNGGNIKGNLELPSQNTNDRSIGVNISIPLSLLNKIDQKRGSTSRSVFVREAINKYFE